MNTAERIAKRIAFLEERIRALTNRDCDEGLAEDEAQDLDDMRAELFDMEEPPFLPGVGVRLIGIVGCM